MIRERGLCISNMMKKSSNSTTNKSTIELTPQSPGKKPLLLEAEALNLVKVQARAGWMHIVCSNSSNSLVGVVVRSREEA